MLKNDILQILFLTFRTEEVDEDDQKQPFKYKEFQQIALVRQMAERLSKVP